MWIDYWEGGKEEKYHIKEKEEECQHDGREVKECHDSCIEEEAECHIDV